MYTCIIGRSAQQRSADVCFRRVQAPPSRRSYFRRSCGAPAPGGMPLLFEALRGPSPLGVGVVESLLSIDGDRAALSREFPTNSGRGVLDLPRQKFVMAPANRRVYAAGMED